MQHAQSWAQNNLIQEFPDEYRDFYLEEKAILLKTGNFKKRIHVNPNSASRARTRLSQLHYKRYRELYKIAVFEGYSTCHRPVAQKEGS